MERHVLGLRFHYRESTVDISDRLSHARSGGSRRREPVTPCVSSFEGVCALNTEDWARVNLVALAAIVPVRRAAKDSPRGCGILELRRRRAMG
jgi:hypothetical protein